MKEGVLWSASQVRRSYYSNIDVGTYCHLVDPDEAEVYVAEVAPFQLKVGTARVLGADPTSPLESDDDVTELIVRDEHLAMQSQRGGCLAL